MVRIFILLFCVLLVMPAQVSADSPLRVRIGEHAKYSRVVFDWAKKVPFEIKKPSSDRLIVSFDDNASVDSASLNVTDVANIKAINILSKTPLTISIEISKGSRTRNFYAGERLVLDIYNPPGAALNDVKPAKNLPPKEKKAKATTRDKVSSHLYEARKVEQESLKTPVAAVDVKVPPQTALKEALSNKKSADSHVITVTSTQNVGMAAFQAYGNLWVITDKNEFYLKPQLNGPKRDAFSKFKESEIVGGLASSIKLPKWSHLRGQGGGLLWRLIVSSKEHDLSPVKPIRNLRPQSEIYGGILIWPFKNPSKILTFKEPTFDEELIVVTANSSRDFSGPVYDFVEFQILETHIGMVIRSKVDDLIVEIIPEGIQVTRPGGLATMSSKTIASIDAIAAENLKYSNKEDTSPKIYRFNEWQVSSANSIYENENIILGELRGIEPESRVESIITLAKMFLSQGYGAEALGYLDFANDEESDLETNPDFLALRGAANVLAWKSDEAFKDLSIDALKPFQEINFWRASALADLDDWQQAYAIMPDSLSTLYQYPEIIRRRLSLVLAEVALRAGDVDEGRELLEVVMGTAQHSSSPLTLSQKSALSYLEGEAYRQLGETNKTKDLWVELSVGKDPLYRAKSKLALTRLLVEDGAISQENRIDNLEGLRYAWRGDQLEASINYWLGRAYFDAHEYVRGLNIMREAITYSSSTNLGKKITTEMTTAFTDLYLKKKLKGVSALDAVAIYEQFRELTPVGTAGDEIVEILSEKLVEADLLGRAGNMMERQVDTRLSGSEAARVSVRLAAIRLLDNLPAKALSSLDKAEEILKTLPVSVATPQRYHEITLLRARAYSQAKKINLALEILGGLALSPEVNRLRANISWKASYWDDAAEALGDVIVDKNISLTRPLSDEDAALILQRSVALNLANDRIGLGNLREKYSDVMLQTSKSRLFEVVTRPHQNATLGDRKTLRGIVSEVDVFKGFLESYIADQKSTN